jgi:hypothetical protein
MSASGIVIHYVYGKIVNALAPGNNTVLNGNFVFNSDDVFYGCNPDVTCDLAVLDCIKNSQK